MSSDQKVISDHDVNLAGEEVFKVSAGSDALSLAVAISKVLTTTLTPTVSVRAVGAGAVNQAVKAVVIARGKVASTGRDLVCRPGFHTVVSRDGGDISAIVFNCSIQ